MSREIKRAVITGGTGMIGVTLVQYLIDKGIDVSVIARPGSKNISNLPKSEKLNIVEADLSELFETEKSLSGKYDVFYHLGWDGTYGESRNDMYLQNLNVKYTLDAVELAHKLGCQVFVGAGSQAEYGRTSEKLSPSTPTFPENGYGIAKLCAGQMSSVLCEKYGIVHVWTRILSIYGPNDGNNTMIMSGIRKMLAGEMAQYTKGEQLWDYLYSKDAAKALYLIALKGKPSAIYCIGSGNARPLAEYILAIRDSIDPELEVKLGAVPYSDKQVMYLCADTDNLITDTGFVPEYGFEDGIRETVEWCRNNN